MGPLELEGLKPFMKSALSLLWRITPPEFIRLMAPPAAPRPSVGVDGDDSSRDWLRVFLNDLGSSGELLGLILATALANSLGRFSVALSLVNRRKGESGNIIGRVAAVGVDPGRETALDRELQAGEAGKDSLKVGDCG